MWVDNRLVRVHLYNLLTICKTSRRKREEMGSIAKKGEDDDYLYHKCYEHGRMSTLSVKIKKECGGWEDCIEK